MLLMGHNESKDNFNNMGSCLTYIKTAKVICVNDCAKKSNFESLTVHKSCSL